MNISKYIHIPEDLKVRRRIMKFIKKNPNHVFGDGVPLTYFLGDDTTAEDYVKTAKREKIW
jgi:hypothetical protein